MKIADYIANHLFNIGVRYVFGIPGGPSIPYIKALRSAGIEFVLTANEASAGIMADVSARLTGIPGVCHATYGPGATNITTGAGGALLDRSPVILLTNEMDDKMISRTTQMNIDHQQLFKPVTKSTMRMTPENAQEVLSAAIAICTKEYPGPVHIGLPSDIANIEINESTYNSNGEERNDYSNHTASIVTHLQSCRRPLLAVGLSSYRLGIQKKLLEFLDHYNIPVVITPMAKGIIPEDHPSYAGVLFHALSDYLKEIYEKTDLVIGLGYDQVEYNYESWMPDVPLVHFDTKESDMPVKGEIARFTGKPEEWFNILNNINAGSLLYEKALITGIKDEMFAVFNGFTNHFGPVTALSILQEELPADTIVTADVGSHLHLTGQYWKTYGKGKFIITNGWSGMGFGIPAAIAAQLHNPEKPVVCITGDGGFLMTAGEIITARRLGLPVIIVVFSDGELNLIRLKQTWQEIPPNGTILYKGELFHSSIFLGIKVLNANSNDSMRLAVNSALSSSEPVIINTQIDPEDYNWLIVKG